MSLKHLVKKENALGKKKKKQKAWGGNIKRTLRAETRTI